MNRYRRGVYVALMAGAVLGVGSAAQAQSGTTSKGPWNLEFGIGFDNSISGNINSSAIGTLNNQTTVILKNQYDDVYGTGLYLRGGGGYAINDLTELRVTFTFQSLDADLVPMGDIGTSKLYAQYTDYQSFAMDVGARRYVELSPRVRGYGEGTIGLGFVDKTDVTLVAPSINLNQKFTDFYDQTAAFAMGANIGALFLTDSRLEFFIQAGLRWVSGMSEVDDLAGTGLETINDKSARTTIPFVGGLRVRF